MKNKINKWTYFKGDKKLINDTIECGGGNEPIGTEKNNYKVGCSVVGILGNTCIGRDCGCGDRIKSIFVILALVVLTGACSFKKDSQGSVPVTGVATISEKKFDPDADSDGDGVKNLAEVERGTDPYVADIPVLETNFVQNFSMNVTYNRINDNTSMNLSISTKVKDTDSSFQYRVGKFFGVEKSMESAAKEGRFSGHSYSNISNEDYSWITYPTLDPLMLHSDIIKFRPVIDGQDSFENFNVSILFESSIKLTGAKFKEIKDLSVNFYYHNYEKDSYVLLKNITINRTFQPKINEKFTIEIQNIPLGFLKDSYLKHGEFLISEIDNYYIPEINKDYKTLMSSIKSKTVPVLLTTPSEDSVYYVASGPKGISFLEVLKTLFVKNFEVEKNTLKRIGQYENNLGSYEHLIELKDKDKLGNWFVLTNEFKEEYLDHLYRPSDHISLSYVTGSKLASQSESVQTSFYKKVSTEPANEKLIPIGEIGPNSKLEIQLKGISRFGHEIAATKFTANYDNGNPRNGTHLDYSCVWVNHKKAAYDRSFDFPISYKEEWENIYLVINEERFKLSTLINDKKLLVRNLDFSYLLTIENIAKIKKIKQSDRNSVSIVILPKLERAHEGVRLVSFGGMTNQSWCSFHPIPNTYSLLASTGGELSKQSIDVGIIEQWIRDAINWPGNSDSAVVRQWKTIYDADYDHNFSMSVSSKIVNYFN